VPLLVAAGARADDMTHCHQALVEACRRAAVAGVAEGQARLGVLLETGLGVARDVPEAAVWYRRAADQGNRFALLRLRALVGSYRMNPPDQRAPDPALRGPAPASPPAGSAAPDVGSYPALVGSYPMNLPDRRAAADPQPPLSGPEPADPPGVGAARGALAGSYPAVVGSYPMDLPDQRVILHAQPGPQPPPPSPSGMAASGAAPGRAVVSADLGRLPKWQRVRDWIVDDTGVERDPALAHWAAWAEGLRDRPVGERLAAINLRVNDGFRYARDSELWGMRNYWPTPPEVVAKGATDCKGFAIMKLWLARLAGLRDGDLALLVGTLPVSDEMHAVLRVAADGRPVLLDSRQPAVMADGGLGLRPILAADLRGLELFIDGAGTAGD
jgi:predicted transglutaminase-like cysteine proteinase